MRSRPPILSCAPLVCLSLVSIFGGAALGAPVRSDDDEEDLAFAVAAAREHYAAGRYWKCADELRGVLEEAPEGALALDARVLLLRTEQARGRLEEADALDAELAAAAAAPVDLPRARAEYALFRGRLDAAEAIARNLLASDAADLDAEWILARALEARGRRAEALAIVDAAAKRLAGRPNSGRELLRLGRLLLVAKRYEDAARALVYAEKALKDAGEPIVDALLELGHVYRGALDLARDEQPRAFAAYREALERNPGLVDARVGRAWMHLYTLASTDAEREIDDALAVNERHPDALVVRAWLQVIDARSNDALATLDVALATNPMHRKARSVRAAALYLLGRKDEFDAEVARVLEIDPAYGELYWTIGDALSGVYRFEEAVPFHRRAAELDPELPLAPVSLGRDLCFCGLEAEGREALEHSMTTHPFRHPWRNNMLMVLDKLGAEFVDNATSHFRLRVHVDENPVLGPLLSDALESDLAHLEEKYGYDVDREVLVESFPDMNDFSVRSVGCGIL